MNSKKKNPDEEASVEDDQFMTAEEKE